MYCHQERVSNLCWKTVTWLGKYLACTIDVGTDFLAVCHFIACANVWPDGTFGIKCRAKWSFHKMFAMSLWTLCEMSPCPLGLWQPWWRHQPSLNIWGWRQTGCHFAHNIFKFVFLNEKYSLKFLPNGPNSNHLLLVQIIAWCRIGDKPLTELIIDNFTDVYVPHSLDYFFNKISLIQWCCMVESNFVVDVKCIIV